MKVAVSYVHFLACVGWTIYWIVLACDTEAHMFEGRGLLQSIAMLLLTTTGIYLFVAGFNRHRTRLQKLKTENAILEKQIEQERLRQQLDAAQKNC